LRLREQYVLSALTALVKSGIDPQGIRSLGDLTSPASFKLLIRERLKSDGPQASAYNEGLAKALIAIAVEWVRPDREIIVELKRLSSRIPKAPAGLTEKNKTVLREFSDPEILERLKKLPDKLWQRAERRPPSFKTLADRQAALAISILTFAPLRISNLVALQFGGTLHLGKRDTLVSLIDIPSSEMKSRQPFMIELPPAVTAKLRAYREMLQAEFGRTPVHLFDTGLGSTKLAASIAWLIKRTIRRHLGLHMTAHQFRHVMGALMIEDEPSASSFETARQLLGHRNIATTVRYYTGQNTISAGRRHQKLIEAKIAGSSLPRAGRRSKKR
jgi:integrase